MGCFGWVSQTYAQGEISHNYSIGEIQIIGNDISQIGGAIGKFNTSTEFDVNHNYYETGKANVTLNNLGEGLSAVNMKTNDFLASLNEGLESSAWKFEAGENDGYPVLIWEE